MQFKYYVLNYDPHNKCIVNYNVFNNIRVNEAVNEEVEKYVKSPNDYVYSSFKGFEALCVCIKNTIMWQQWSRREYEISVGDAFCKEDTLEKWDVYRQCEPNIQTITRECIWQYEHKEG